MYTEITTQQITVNDIPTDVNEGYNHPDNGIINYPNGHFGMYSIVTLLGDNGEPSVDNEAGGFTGCNLLFTELPCDASGTILFDHYDLKQLRKTNAGEEDVNALQVLLVCRKKPTHRVNLRTGEISANRQDNVFITGIKLNYLIGN